MSYGQIMLSSGVVYRGAQGWSLGARRTEGAVKLNMSFLVFPPSSVSLNKTEATHRRTVSVQ